MRLEEIAERLGCELRGAPDTEISRVWPIESAGRGDLSFVANPRYARYLAETGASALIVAHDQAEVAIPTLRTDDPYLAFSRALRLFYQPPPRVPGIHPSAVIASGSLVGEGAAIGPHTVIESGVRIGVGATIGSGVAIYHGAVIGDRFTAHANAVVRESVRIGNGVTLHAGAIIGSDGFGYVPIDAGKLEKVVQSGTVVIGDDVEIGANATIDRATVGETRIGAGVKIDNLVQVGHGCEIGENTLIAAQAGLAGSTVIGAWVQLGGQAGTAGHMKIGDSSLVAGRAGVTGDIEPGSVVGGFPAVPIQQWRRAAVLWSRVGELFRRVRKLENAGSENLGAAAAGRAGGREDSSGGA